VKIASGRDVSVTSFIPDGGSDAIVFHSHEDAAGSDDDAPPSRGKKRGRDASEADSSDHIGLAKGMWQVLRERGAVIKDVF